MPGPSALLGLLEAAGAKGLTCPQLFSTRSRIICRAAARSVELPSSELIARLLLSELANAARGETDQKRKDRKRMEAEQLASMTERHPDVFKVLIREIGEDGKADVFLGKALAYCPRPSFSSQSATCCIAAAPRISGLHPPASARLPDKSQAQ